MAGNDRIYAKTMHKQTSHKNVNTCEIETHHSSEQNFDVTQ